MDEHYSIKSASDLHTIVALQEIDVRDDVKLRPLDMGDAESLLRILDKDGSIRKRVTVASRLFTIDDVVKEIESMQADPGLVRYTILENNDPVGLVSLWRDEGFFGTQPQYDDYGFGYFLDSDKRGKGLVSSSVKSLMAAVRANLAVRQFIAFCEDNNSESASVLKKLGFEPTEETHAEPTHGWAERKYIKVLRIGLENLCRVV